MGAFGEDGAVIDSPPPPSALAWAAGVAGPGATAHTVRRLAGGTHAATHALRTEHPTVEMVLRRFPPGDTAAAREARMLTLLDGLDGWAPRLLGADPEGHRAGRPATLLSQLPGRADITSLPAEASATQLGEALARVHAVPVAHLGELRDGAATAASSAADAYATAPAAPILAAHGHRLADQPLVLTHYDFWSGNVLWQDRQLTGIVDWSGASRAPRGYDVSWCRLDLVLLHGPTAAEVFLTAYERAAAEPVPELALWDLFALTNSHRAVESWLPNYHDLGRTDLSTSELRARHTAWTEHSLARHEAAQRPPS